MAPDSHSHIPLVARAWEHVTRRAIVAEEGIFSYRDLLDASAGVAAILLDGAADLQERRVAFIVRPGFTHVKVQWGIWRAGGVAVPLCVSHPRPELEYAIEEADVDVVVADPAAESLVRPLAAKSGLRFLGTAALSDAALRNSELPDAESSSLPDVSPGRRAMIVFTSGTTGRPKGVVSTHGAIRAQIESLVLAWGWRSDDHILEVLPLHHVHGIINVVSCALWSGATCEMLPKFEAKTVWERCVESGATLFMAVPTIYSKLIAAWESAPPETRRIWSAAGSTMRLMVSGSAALPVDVLQRWRTITGQVLLERYGMTEFGMALSNPLCGERRAGSVGTPLPGVDVRLVDESGTPVGPGEQGEIEVRGDGVFFEYWKRPEETRGVFRSGGWFRTGDVAVVEDGVYRILGRRSVDIINTGGFKVSALEIEEVLRSHGDISECAVVGLPDPEWGERVAAALVFEDDRELSLTALRDWAKSRMAHYKVPATILGLVALPRNSIGKVTKPAVVELFEQAESH